ncbi:uncharacterized protein LOC143898283 isoform X2 [Temnothorax americanus]|uniref:uncharacterized protein LOC143898283 isoform X2 n=1 Tax=Temnothorax americanus TaxID=1964332 RepID=UPI0040681BB3
MKELGRRLRRPRKGIGHRWSNIANHRGADYTWLTTPLSIGIKDSEESYIFDIKPHTLHHSMQNVSIKTFRIVITFIISIGRDMSRTICALGNRK